MAYNSEEESLYLTMRNSIHDEVLGLLRAQQNGRDDIVIMADEAAASILKMFGVDEPISLKRKFRGAEQW